MNNVLYNAVRILKKDLLNRFGKYVWHVHGRYSEEDEISLGVTVRVLKWDITADKLEEIGTLYRIEGY